MTTAQEFDQLLADLEAAKLACRETEPETEEEDDALGDRHEDALRAVETARPQDLAGMAKYIRWAVDDGELIQDQIVPSLLAIADRLEAME